MKWLYVVVLLLSGCVTTIHHDITNVTTDDTPTPVTTKPVVKTVRTPPKVVTRYKDRVVTQPSTCRFVLPTIPPMPEALIINDTDSVKDREHAMAMHIKAVRSYTTAVLGRVNQQYTDYNSKCK